MALALQLGVALLMMSARVEAQGGLIPGTCRGYQSTASFDDAYIAKLTSASDGYAVLLTSDRPRTSNCHRLTLYSNGTFLFTYNDDYNRLRNHSDTYNIEQYSFHQPGYIRLRMPSAAFGATLTGDLRLYVLVVADDYFVATSCWEPLPYLRNEYVHVFVPAAKVDTISPSELQTSLVAMGVPSAAHLREVHQGCFANIRFLDTQGKADFYNFLVKIGLAPPLPIQRVSEIRAGIPAQLYSTPTNFIASHPGHHFVPSAVATAHHFAPSAVAPAHPGHHFAPSAVATAHPGHHFAPSAGATVPSFVYGPSSTVSGTGSPAGQEQSFVYDAALPSSNHLFRHDAALPSSSNLFRHDAALPSLSHLTPAVISFPSPSGFVPVSSDVNYVPQGFSISAQDEILLNSPPVGHGSSVVAFPSSPGIIYNLPVAGYTPEGFSFANLPTFTHNPHVVVSYASSNSGGNVYEANIVNSV